MKRFRVTLLAICLILGWLGYSDLSLYFRNLKPQEVTIGELERQGAPREWLSISGGYQDLLEAINMSGTVEIDTFLVPLKSSRENPVAKVWFETRDPKIVAALKHYYFELDSQKQRRAYREENQEFLHARRDVTGMLPDSPVAASNRSKLTELLKETKAPATEDVIFISEGKTPAKYRGFFYAGMALLGLLKFAYDLKTGDKEKPTNTPPASNA